MLKQQFENYKFHLACYSSQETYRFYDSHLRCILNKMLEYGINDVHDISVTIVKHYIISMKTHNLSNNTINKRIMCIRGILKYYHCSSYSDICRLPRLKQPYKTIDFLTNKQVLLLLNYIDSSSMKIRNKLILRLFLDTGCRCNELINIKIDNIDLDHNCILLQTTKNGNERYVFFTDDVKVRYLLPYLNEHYNQLFLFEDINKYGIQSLFHRIKDTLGFKKFSPHMLRHTYATILVNNNTNLEFIRVTLGHSSLDITKRYLHFSQESLFNTYFKYFVISS